MAALGLFAAGAVATSATAAAQPPAPEPPAPAPGPPPAPSGPPAPFIGAPVTPDAFSILAQTGQESVPGAAGAPNTAGLDRTTVLGQNPAPATPGGPGTPPNLNVFNNAYGIQQNIEPAAPGQGQQFDVPPGQENADVSKREWFGRYIDMYRAGMLKGGLLGQVPQESLGQPLPGTEPPPGTNIPPGLVQFLPPPPEPAAPPGPAAAPGAPVAPLPPG
jgi:hypothetical protein